MTGVVLRYQFCPKCGGNLKNKNVDGRDRLVCARCGFIFYQNPVPASIVLIEQDNKILLVRRKYDPGAGLWCLPGGFIEFGESPAEAAQREVQEETGLDIAVNRLYDVTNTCVPAENVLIVYVGDVRGGQLLPGDDATAVGYFAFNHLPKIAFRVHRELIQGYFGKK